MQKNDIEHIKLLYSNFEKINLYIKQAIEKNEIETIQNIFSSKNKLIKQIVAFEKIHHKEIKENEELFSIKMKLIEKEKENIKLLEELKISLTKEYTKTNKTKKLHNAYEPSLNETRSTFDFVDEELD